MSKQTNFDIFKETLAKNISIPAMIDFNAGKEELLLEIISDILNDLETNKVCPCCGDKLYLSDLDTFDYVCAYCDKRFRDKEVREYNYYVLEFRINNDPNHTSSMCVLGYRKPTIEEAKKFWKADCELYDDELLADIYEISKEEAYDSFDMTNEHTWPIFGKEKETMLYCNNCSTSFAEKDAKRNAKEANKYGMDTENYICPICWSDESVITKIND